MKLIAEYTQFRPSAHAVSEAKERAANNGKLSDDSHQVVKFANINADSLAYGA